MKPKRKRYVLGENEVRELFIGGTSTHAVMRGFPFKSEVLMYVNYSIPVGKYRHILEEL